MLEGAFPGDDPLDGAARRGNPGEVLVAAVLQEEVKEAAVRREARLLDVAVQGLGQRRDAPPATGITATWLVSYQTSLGSPPAR